VCIDADLQVSFQQLTTGKTFIFYNLIYCWNFQRLLRIAIVLLHQLRPIWVLSRMRLCQRSKFNRKFRLHRLRAATWTATLRPQSNSVILRRFDEINIGAFIELVFVSSLFFIDFKQVTFHLQDKISGKQFISYKLLYTKYD
jgi:hypothetical protein